jgi:tetratricopeptide (TPR) repeat protein
VTTTPGVQIPDPLPLVGRAGEFDRLKELLGAEDRRTSVVVLSGEGGVGKTRLAAEVAQEAEKKGWTVARGRAYPVETGVPYALFADAFLPIMREMDAARLTVLSRGGEAELRRLFPALGGGDGFVDTSGDPDEFRTRLMWNFTEFLKSYAKKAPLLCVLEDLQWADGSSLELLHFIARQVTGHPVVILCSCNDAEQERGSQLVQIERSLVSLGVGEIRRLSALSRDEVTELLSATFDVDASVVREFSALLYGWTRGNVFFVEEILKSMLASGGIARENGVWVGWDATDFRLPGSIRDAVLGRMGSLSDDAQGVAELAAVIGARSRYPLLAALGGLDEPTLLVALEELCHHRVLDERMEDGGVVYVFSHPMVRQTLYGELSLQRARSLHGKVAEAMEALHGERALDHADELAYHFSRTDAAHLRRKATGYLAEAGRRALERRAGPEAVDYLEAALESARNEADADAASTARLVVLLARARQHVGDFEGAVDLWREALAHVPRDAPEYPDVCRALGMAHFWCGHHDDAHRRLDEGLEAAETLGDRAAVVRSRVAKGHCLHEVGRGADALETVLPALPIAERLGDVGAEARVHRALALLYLWIGPPEKARQHGRRAIELAREAGDVTIEFWARWGLAVLGGMRGETGDMRDAIEEIKETGRPLAFSRAQPLDRRDGDRAGVRPGRVGFGDRPRRAVDRAGTRSPSTNAATSSARVDIPLLPGARAARARA